MVTSENREDQPSYSSRKRHKTSTAKCFRDEAATHQSQGKTRDSSQVRQVTFFHYQ